MTSRSDMNLQLSLKRQWFEMTKDGIKTEDYREITPYWCKRLVGWWSYKGEKKGQFPDLENSFMSSFGIMKFKNFNTNTMTLGYPSKNDNQRILIFEHAGIEIRTGNHEWGAEEGKLYFVIKHGKRLQ